jgi:peptide chain release factor 1
MIDKRDITIERITGSGPGGQHRNKTASCVRVTHNPSGIQVCIDGRYQHKNLAVAMRELERRIAAAKQGRKDAERKSRRDHAIKNEITIRTYDFKLGLAFDHRTGKKAPLKQVLGKGRFELIAPNPMTVEE